MYDKSYLVRQLVPKSFHFDGYDMVNCPNRRDKPLFMDNVIPMGTHYLTTHLVGKDTLSIEFSSICPVGEITFKPYYITIDEFALKLKKMMQDGCDFITLEIKIQCEHFHAPSCRKCVSRNPDCSKLRNNSVVDPVLAAISFHTKHVKEALAAYYEITNTTTQRKGDIFMKNYGKKKNLFGLNFELGMSKDPNIAATLMGVAVKNPESGNWYTFDQATNTRKNIANLKMGNFPIFLLPTKVLAVGDLVKMNGKYFYVKSLSSHNTVTLIGATDGIIQEMLPEESIIPGMTLYTKVVAFDTKSLTDTASNQNMGGNVLAAMLMMQWAKGNGSDEFSLDNISDDSFNGLGSLWPMLAMSGQNIGGMFTSADGSINLPMLMMLGSGSDSDDDASGMMQMLVLSQLLGNGTSTASNALSDVMSQLPIPGAVGSPATNKAKVLCEKCNVTYPAGTNFCPKCGKPTMAAYSNCIKCGAKLMDGASFCHKCGTKVGANTCPNCGKKITGEEKFCSNCGTVLTGIKVSATPYPVGTIETGAEVSDPAEVLKESPTKEPPTSEKEE